MSRDTVNIRRVAPPKKGYDAERTLRFPSALKEPLELLAWISHRGVNDEIVVAIEERIRKYRAQIEDARKRREGK